MSYPPPYDNFITRVQFIDGDLVITHIDKKDFYKENPDDEKFRITDELKSFLRDADLLK